MHHRTRPLARSRTKSVCLALVASLSLLAALCAPFMTRPAHAQAPAQTPLPIATPTPAPPGQPPGANLPNLDVMRKLQSVIPVVTRPAFVPLGLMPNCDGGSDCGVGPGGGPPPSPPNDPNYSTARTEPYNSTGEPGITLGSRNFNWSTSLVSLSGRSGSDLNVSLTYNSLVWTQERGMIKFNADQGFPGPGFRLGFPIIQPRYYNSDTGFWSYLMVTPSGGRVDFRQLGTSSTYETFDSTYSQLIDNSGTLLVRTADGTQMTFAISGPNYVCNQIKDRNGNYISATYNGNLPTAIADTLGRVINFNYDNGFLASITQNGKTQPWATFSYASLLFNYNFPGLQVDAPQNGSLLALPAQVNLDDGSSYQFTYNTWGRLRSMTMTRAC